MFDEENYIVIKGWMITNLNLSGNKLLAFAIIYGFCQGGLQKYNGSLNYLASALNTSKPTAMKALNDLLNLNFITKKHFTNNNIQRCEYDINFEVVKKLYRGGKETLPVGGKETLPVGGKETLPNNTNTIPIHNNKKKEMRAHEFLKKNFPSQFEVIEMRYKKRFSEKDWEDVLILCSNKIVSEDLKWESRILIARFENFIINWIRRGQGENKKPKFSNKPTFDTNR